MLWIVRGRELIMYSKVVSKVNEQAVRVLGAVVRLECAWINHSRHETLDDDKKGKQTRSSHESRTALSTTITTLSWRGPRVAVDFLLLHEINSPVKRIPCCLSVALETLAWAYARETCHWLIAILCHA